MNDKPIIGPYGVNQEGSGDMYYKGALLLHTIRTLLSNDSLFFSIIKGIQKDFYHSIVTTQQIENYFPTKTGIDFSQIFDQYLRHSSPPKIVIRSADGVVQYRWKTDVAKFYMPVLIYNADGSTMQLEPKDEWQTLPGYTTADKVKVATDLLYVKVVKE